MSARPIWEPDQETLVQPGLGAYVADVIDVDRTVEEALWDLEQAGDTERIELQLG
jgi:hypothetical protein